MSARQLWFRQGSAILRLEWKKGIFSRRGWWIYLLALGPVGLAYCPLLSPTQ